MKKQESTNKGITLIALVITIIVLLILAGVALATLTGDSGILNNAENAKENTNLANIKEKVQLAIMEHKVGQYSEGKTLKEYLESAGATNVTEDGTEGQLDGYNFKIENGVVTVTKGSVEETPPPPTSKLTPEEKTALANNGIAELTAEEIALLENADDLTNSENAKNIKAVLTGGVVIPTNFTYVEGTKDTGVVVSVVGANNVVSEFVWVPVDEISTMTQLQTGSTENYQGKLYDSWTATSSTLKTDWTPGTTNKREPSLVTNSSDDKSAVLSEVTGTNHDAAESLYAEGGIFNGYFTDAKAFGQAMQDDYNSMVESVIKYKGFYIGRYETSINGETVASTTGTEDTRPMASKKWYEMYKLQREFSNSDASLSAVKSSMVWGSQYDAMLNWVIETETDAAKIIATTNASHDNSTNGAYRPGTETVEGKTDKINNIYDLEGNVTEWTLEANYTYSRVLRGGYYSLAHSPSERRDNWVSASGSAYYGSRATLYIQ